MDIKLSWPMAVVLFSVIINTIIVVYNAGKMSGLINHLHECIHRLDGESKAKDAAIARAHERIDEVIKNK